MTTGVAVNTGETVATAVVRSCGRRMAILAAPVIAADRGDGRRAVGVHQAVIKRLGYIS